MRFDSTWFATLSINEYIVILIECEQKSLKYTQILVFEQIN